MVRVYFFINNQLLTERIPSFHLSFLSSCHYQGRTGITCSYCKWNGSSSSWPYCNHKQKSTIIIRHYQRCQRWRCSTRAFRYPFCLCSSFKIFYFSHHDANYVYVPKILKSLKVYLFNVSLFLVRNNFFLLSIGAIGLRGMQLFVDAGIPVDNDLVRNLILEVLREKICSMIGFPKPQAEPSSEQQVPRD